MSEEEKDFLDDVFDVGKRMAKNVGRNLEGGITQLITNEITKNLSGTEAEPPPQGPAPPSPVDTGMQTPAFSKQPSGERIEGFRENNQWLFGGEGNTPNSVTLSAPTDHFTTSDLITVLNPAEFFVFYFRTISVGQGGEFAHQLQVIADDQTEKDKEGRWAFNFNEGEEVLNDCELRVAGEVIGSSEDVRLAYKPDDINQGIILYDGKYLGLLLNGQEHDGKVIVRGGQWPIRFRVVGMEVCIWG